MKKTQSINLGSMRKQVRRFGIAPIALAVLAGCSPAKEEVKFVTSVDDCKTSTELSDEQCEAAYAKAVRDAEATSPRYQHERDCAQEFGSCQRNSSGFFMPFMAGYILSDLVGGNRGSSYNNNTYPVYTYRGQGSNSNRIMTADGHVIGKAGQSSYSVKPDALKPKPKPTVTKTVSRGGFGSKAAAKSSWGSSKSSSSRSSGWGG